MIPKSKPQATQKTVLAAAYKVWRKERPNEELPKMFVVGVRGYYSETFAPSGNNRSIYDDGIFVIGPETFAAFNANTDPSSFKAGIASLLPGIHPYKMGNHGISKPGGGYPAFRPATKNEELPVKRDGESRIPSARPGVAINIHKGGKNTTSSAGCQTLYPTQWDAFYAITKSEMLKAGQRTFFYVLIDGPIN